MPNKIPCKISRLDTVSIINIELPSNPNHWSIHGGCDGVGLTIFFYDLADLDDIAAAIRGAALEIPAENPEEVAP